MIRFKEIISTQKIVDKYTMTQYDGLIDTELLNLINDIHKEKEQAENKVSSLRTLTNELNNEIELLLIFFKEKGHDYEEFSKFLITHMKGNNPKLEEDLKEFFDE